MSRATGPVVTRPHRPVGVAPGGTPVRAKPVGASSATPSKATAATPTPATKQAAAATPTNQASHAAASPSPARAAASAVPAAVAAAAADEDADDDFTPLPMRASASPAAASASKPIGSAAAAREREADRAASRTAAAARRHSDSDDDDDEGGDNEEGKRLNFKRVLQQDAAERKQEALEAAATARANGSVVASGTVADAAAFTLAGTRELLAGAPDIMGAPALPAQNDEDNDLFYCPRLSEATLARITGERDLRRVTTLSLHLNTEEQELDQLSTFLPSLTTLALIPPSSVSSLRDFGRSLTAIQFLALPRCGLTDLDGVETLQRLVELAVPANQIDDLSPLMFASAATLTRLDLRDNRIADSDTVEFLASLPKLTVLDLEGNPLSARRHYRALVGARTAELPPGQLVLDGVALTELERVRLPDATEGMVDREKSRALQARLDDPALCGSTYSHPGSGGGIMQRLQQQKSGHAGAAIGASGGPTSGGSPSQHRNDLSGVAALGAGKARDALLHHSSSSASSATAAAALAAAQPSLPASSQSAAALAARRREFQAFLGAKGDPLAPLDVGAPTHQDEAAAATAALAARARAKQKEERSTAVADLLRLEQEDAEADAAAAKGGQQRSAVAGSANAYAQRLLEARQAKAAATATASGASSSSASMPGAVPRLQFDAAFSANNADLDGSSPSPSPSLSLGQARPGSARGRPSTAGVGDASLSLATPRPGTASAGGRPGSASGARPGTASGMRSGSAGDDPALQQHSIADDLDGASDLTYGSSSIMAGNYAQAMRARKKQGSFSASATANSDDGSRSPSALSRPQSSSTAAHPRPTSSSSRSASPAPGMGVARGSALAAATAVASSPVHSSVPAPLTSPTGGSRPAVLGGSGASSSSSMLARHRATSGSSSSASSVTHPAATFSLASPPSASASSSASRSAGGKPDDDVLFVIPPKKPAADASTSAPKPTASGGGKTYTLVRKKPV